MKTLLIIGVLLTLAGATLANNIGVSGTWMFQAGVVFLFGAVAIFVAERRATTEHSTTWKIVGIVSFILMLLLTIWGFINGIWYAHPLGFFIALAGTIWVSYRGMKSGIISYKPTKEQFIVGAVVLVVLLFFVFSNEPATQQTLNSQEPLTNGLNNPNATNDLSKTPTILTPEERLRAQISKNFQGLSPKIIEIKIEDGVSGKIVTVKYSRNKGSNYIYDDAGGIYKAIFTYGDEVQKAVLEQYFTSFEDKYGNRCELLAWTSKIDNPTTITKVNWKEISEDSVQPWWIETYMYELDDMCK